MRYSEKKEISKIYKTHYVNGIERLIEKREQECLTRRREYFQASAARQEEYRRELKSILGWPLNGYNVEGVISVRKHKLCNEGSYSIYRMEFEVLDGLTITGLLFQKDNLKKPLVIAQHGKLGTPEHVAGFYGSTTNYNNMISRILKYDVNVFAPQLLLWNEESYQVSYNRALIDARLKRVGSSIAAVEIWGLQKILDYFQTQKFVSDFGMIGLSYGGFYTLLLAAIDTRVKAAISCSYFNDRKKYLFEDWTWFNVASKFNDAEIASLIYPRRLFLQVGTEDTFFDVRDAITEYERLKNMWKDDLQWLEWNIFHGGHEFGLDDSLIERLVSEIR